MRIERHTITAAPVSLSVHGCPYRMPYRTRKRATRLERPRIGTIIFVLYGVLKPVTDSSHSRLLVRQARRGEALRLAVSPARRTAPRTPLVRYYIVYSVPQLIFNIQSAPESG